MTRLTRRGSVYVLVLGVSTLVLTIGVGATMLARNSLDRQSTGEELQGADAAARSGLELLLGSLNNQPGTIGGMPRDTLDLPTDIGGYTVSMALSDPDGTSPWGRGGQRVKLIVLAKKGDVRQLRSVIVEPVLGASGDGPYFRTIPGSYRIEVQ